MSPSQAFGTFGELPNWVYDVVNAIDKYEEEHPNSVQARMQGPSDMLVLVDHRPTAPDYGGWDWCIKPIQDLIPSEVHEVAHHIRRYRQDAS